MSELHIDSVRHIWESRNCGSCEELAEKHDALAATVEALRVAALNAIHQMSGGEAKADLRDAYDATPQQHLRDVQAEAGRAGFIACIRLAYELQHPPGTIHADQYAEKVRSGKV